MFARNFDQWQKQAAAWLKKPSIEDEAKETIIRQMRFATMFDGDTKHRDTILGLLLKC
jgi:hypothetical protein